MKIIDRITVAVSTSSELKEALEKDNCYTYIYLASDITLTSGINISGTKSNVIIDGTYENIRHTYTDMKSTSASNTITASNKLILKVTVKNVDITGYNYYGIIYVPESATYQNTVVEYSGITYVGPQISFHPYGLTRFINSNITIRENYAAGNEVAECNKIEIGGTTSIIHKSTANSSFWFRNANPSLTILKNAIVTFESENRELIYGVTNLTFKIEENATFSVKTKNGLAYGTNGTGTTQIEKNATFTIKQTTANGTYSTWYSYGNIQIEKNASLNIINDFTNINTSNYNINFPNASSFILNNPNNITIYNTKANIINTSNTVNFDFTFSRINLFDKVVTLQSEISKDTKPTYSWYKSAELSKIKGTFTNAKTNITETNITEDMTNFIFTNKKIMSIGDMPLNINAITDESLEITGKTIPASVLTEYNDTSLTTLTDENGNFTFEIETALPVGTVITFTSKENNSVIYKTKEVTIVYSGSLTIDQYPSLITFTLNPVQTNPILLSKTEDIKIKIIDTRINSTPWHLYATADNLKDQDKFLENSIIFLERGKITVLSGEKTLIYTGESNTRETIVTFSKDSGILAQITDKIDINKIYTAQIKWILEE